MKRISLMVLVIVGIASLALSTENALDNPGFETGNNDGWTSGCDHLTPAVVSGGHSGSYSFCLSGSWSGWSWNQNYQEKAVDNGDSLCYGAWMNISVLDMTSGWNAIGIKAEGAGIGIEDSVSTLTAGWEKFHIIGEATSAANLTCRQMACGDAVINNCVINYDDAELFVNALTNPGFETGDTTGWTITNDNPSTMFMDVVTTTVKTGTYSAVIAGSWGPGWGWHAFDQQIAVNQGTEVTLNGKVNIVKNTWSGGWTVTGVKIEGAVPGTEHTLDTTTDGWKTFSVTNTATVTGNVKALLMSCGDTTMTDLEVFFDNVALNTDEPFTRSGAWEVY